MDYAFLDKARYNRHILLDEVGAQGQIKLLKSKVLVVGTGGLGSPALMYLAAAGVGTLGIIDFDVVDVSNLQRQIIHSSNNVGKAKVESAKETISRINPSITVTTYNEPLTKDNALQIIDGYDVVIDGTDNYHTRYLINDACVLLGKPNVFGSIYKFEGQVSVFNPKKSGCYRCLYPKPPKAGDVQTCSDVGVIGVLPGIIGTLQACEALKIILGIGETLENHLLLFNAFEMTFSEIATAKNEECPICGQTPTIKELIDYEAFCGIKSKADNEFDITAQELKARLCDNGNIQIIDLRDENEKDIIRFEGAKEIPFNEALKRENELDSSKSIVFVCRIGEKSVSVISALKAMGYKGELLNLKGGINEWAKEINSPELQY